MKKLMILVFAIGLVLPSSVWAADPGYDAWAMWYCKQIKRKQVGQMTQIWFNSFRPSTVGDTYLSLAKQYDVVDQRRLSPPVRAHVQKAMRSAVEVAELYAQGLGVDIETTTTTVAKDGGKTEQSIKIMSSRERRIRQLVQEVTESEESVMRALAAAEQKPQAPPVVVAKPKAAPVVASKPKDVECCPAD